MNTLLEEIDVKLVEEVFMCLLKHPACENQACAICKLYKLFKPFLNYLENPSLGLIVATGELKLTSLFIVGFVTALNYTEVIELRRMSSLETHIKKEETPNG